MNEAPAWVRSIRLRLDSASSYDPFQQVGIVMAIRKIADQKRSLISRSVLWDVLFDDGFYEGAAQDIAVGSRYTSLGHDADLPIAAEAQRTLGH